jgi:hypothetical protein
VDSRLLASVSDGTLGGHPLDGTIRRRDRTCACLLRERVEPLSFVVCDACALSQVKLGDTCAAKRDRRAQSVESVGESRMDDRRLLVAEQQRQRATAMTTVTRRLREIGIPAPGSLATASADESALAANLQSR